MSTTSLHQRSTPTSPSNSPGMESRDCPHESMFIKPDSTRGPAVRTHDPTHVVRIRRMKERRIPMYFRDDNIHVHSTRGPKTVLQINSLPHRRDVRTITPPISTKVTLVDMHPATRPPERNEYGTGVSSTVTVTNTRHFKQELRPLLRPDKETTLSPVSVTVTEDGTKTV